VQIAFISYWSCPRSRLGVLSSGGMNVYTLNLARELGKLGHRVDIFTKTHQSHEKRINQLVHNVRLIHLDSGYGNDYIKSRQFGKNLLKFIKENSWEYDIFHAHYFFSGLSFLESASDKPMAMTFHTLGEMKKKYAGIDDSFRIKAEKNIAAKASALIASTELEKDELVRYYQTKPGKVHVVSPGVDHHLFRPLDKNKSREKLNLPKTKKIILFVGRIDPVKGINLLIDAVGNLTDKHPEFEKTVQVLLIGGDIKSRLFWQNPEVKKIVRNIAGRNLSCCIKFLGSKAHNRLPGYYSAADLVVLPSVYESFGLVVLEAMSGGAAIIASGSGGLKHLIEDGDTGIFFKSQDAQDLAKKIWELLHNPQKMESLGKNAYTESHKYCWDKQAEKIVKVYRQLIR